MALVYHGAVFTLSPYDTRSRYLVEPSEDTPLSHEEQAAIARSRAALCAFLNIHFNTLPDERFVDQLRGVEFNQALVALAVEDNDPEMAKGAALMRAFVGEYAKVRAEDFAQALGVDRTKLYRGVSPSYGPPPPHEAVWDKRVPDPVAVLKALAEVYVAAGVGMAEQARERLDYIGVELDFLRLLAVREMEAWQAGKPVEAKLVMEQQLSFLRDHVGRWVPEFFETAFPQAQTDFYRGHLTMLRGFLASEQQRLEVLVESL